MLSAAPRMDSYTSQSTFRVLLSALARPGRIHHLPRRADGPSAVPLALADLDTPVAVIGHDEQRDAVVAATGAPIAPLEAAALVAFWRPPTLEEIGCLSTGTVLDPERGAKVGIACEALVGDDSELRASPVVVLSGPGVNGTITLGVSGLQASFFSAVSERNARFPIGFDLWLVDQSGAVAAIPRSSHIEVN